MKKLIITAAAAILLGALSPAASAHGPGYHDGYRYVERGYRYDLRHHRRDVRRLHRHAHRHAHRRAHRAHRVLRHHRAHRCRIAHRHYHRGVAYYGDLEAIVLGALAYGIVREAID